MNHDLVRIVALVIVLAVFVLYIRTVSKRRKADHEEDCQDEGTCGVLLPACSIPVLENIDVSSTTGYIESVEGANDPAHDATLTLCVFNHTVLDDITNGGMIVRYYLPYHDGGVNFVDGLALDDGSAVMSGPDMYTMQMYVPYWLSVGSVPTCDFGDSGDGSLMSFYPVSFWQSPDTVSQLNTITALTGTDTINVSWSPIAGVDEYAVELRVFGTLGTADDILPVSTPLNLRYGTTTNSTSAAIQVPALDFWGGSIDDIEVRVRGYRYCDLGEPIETCEGGYVD